MRPCWICDQETPAPDATIGWAAVHKACYEREGSERSRQIIKDKFGLDRSNTRTP